MHTPRRLTARVNCIPIDDRLRPTDAVSLRETKGCINKNSLHRNTWRKAKYVAQGIAISQLQHYRWGGLPEPWEAQRLWE
jgi:hypothetical protein